MTSKQPGVPASNSCSDGFGILSRRPNASSFGPSWCPARALPRMYRRSSGLISRNFKERASRGASSNPEQAGAACLQNTPTRRNVPLPPQDPGKNQGSHNRGIRFDNVFWGVQRKLTPGDFLIWHSAGIRSVAGCRIADLTEITPARNVYPLQILVEHRYDANREVPCDAARNLKKPDRRMF